MLESNRIEGENRINPGDIEAVKYALAGIHSEEDICTLHRILGEYLDKPWVGSLRTCNVRVGNSQCISYIVVSNYIEKFLREFPSLDSFEAHNEFETIHPFQDLNGRVGRLVWLNKAVQEGYDFSISFLQMYYYQTLRHYVRR